MEGGKGTLPSLPPSLPPIHHSHPLTPLNRHSDDPIFQELVALLYPHVAADEEAENKDMQARERKVGRREKEGDGEKGREGGKRKDKEGGDEKLKEEVKMRGQATK